jgi:hypothetical protein
MTTPRRAIVRAAPPPSAAAQRLQVLRRRLESEQIALRRWLTRLRRAFHATEKQQGRVARLERQIAKLENPS